MPRQADLLPGTLGMLILRTLARNGSLHGYGISQFLRQTSNGVLDVEEGSLYPALQRLLIKGLVKAEWRVSDTNRRARFYTLSAAGRRQLDAEVAEFSRMVQAIETVLGEA
jgi:PadR family transcriptional regulator, regulatory protein PadR